MGSALDSLSEVQKLRFRSGNTRLGLAPDFVSFEGTFTTPPGVSTLTSDVKTSVIKPTMIPVKDIAEMKRMAGIPDLDYAQRKVSDIAIFYPAPLSDERWGALKKCQDACDFLFQMTSQERVLVEKAAAAYIQGYSQKVKSWEPLLNALYFPSQITAVSGDSLEVKSGCKFVIDAQNPVLNFAAVTVDYGGQIEVTVNASLTTQTFTAAPPA